jgi:SAM-dependent methyltransferase
VEEAREQTTASNIRSSPSTHLYPEIQAGGFSRVDGMIEFSMRVNALIGEVGRDAVVLDFGAGRGAFLEDPVPFRRDLRLLQGKVRRVVGIDIDNAVLQNAALDEAYVVHVGDRLPLEDGSIDLIISVFTFEHVTNPAWVASELDRVLRPGGWLCALTPNRWGYIGIAARIVPNRLHSLVLRRLQPTKRLEDTFPTAYRLNTLKDLKRWFPEGRYHHIVYAADSEPAYAGRSLTAARLNQAGFAFTPPRYRSMLFAFLAKV